MDEQQLIELGRRMTDPFNASDWASYAAAMTEDTSYESPRASARGRAEIMQFVTGAKET